VRRSRRSAKPRGAGRAEEGVQAPGVARADILHERHRMSGQAVRCRTVQPGLAATVGAADHHHLRPESCGEVLADVDMPSVTNGGARRAFREVA
jgi:hypothetical protein